MNTFAGKTAAEWAAEAQKSRQNARDSFERCDTDGFLTQWASDTMARRYDECAHAAEHGGRIYITAAFTLDGEIASIDYREGKFGWYFLIHREAEGLTGVRFWTPSNARKAKTRAANNARKGFTEGKVSVPAYLDEKTGMVKPDMDAANNGDVEIVSVDCYQTQDH